MLNFSVANQIFKTSSNEEYVIVGNDALMKCIIPSFVSDWVAVVGWEDSEGDLYHRDHPALGKAAAYSLVVILQGNTANLTYTAHGYVSFSNLLCICIASICICKVQFN